MCFFGTGTADKRNCQNTILVHVLHIITYSTLSGAKSQNMSHKKESFPAGFIAFHLILPEMGQASTYLGMCRSFFFFVDLIQISPCSVYSVVDIQIEAFINHNASIDPDCSE